MAVLTLTCTLSGLFQLPTDVDLGAVCLPDNAVTFSFENGVYMLVADIPDEVAASLLPSSVRVVNAELKVSVSSATRSVELEISGSLQLGGEQLAVSIVFDTSNGCASISGSYLVPGGSLSANDILSVFSPSFASSVGLTDVSINELELRLKIAPGVTPTYYFRILIASAKDLATALIGTAGLPTGDIQSVLEAAGLDSFDIQNVELLVSNEGGPFSIAVSGSPVLPALDGLPPVTVEIEAFNIGTPQRSVNYGFNVSDYVGHLKEYTCKNG